jgi:pyruvate dehydrogenase E2 component (dihydrolipoamide acetyltransferase)
MALELKMPALSPTMEKGNLAKWLVSVGDVVRPGDVIAEIETDKATMELEAEDSGRIARLVVAAGSDDVAVGTVIALLVDADAVVDAVVEAVAPIVPPLVISAVVPLPAKVAPIVEQVTAAPAALANDNIMVTPLAQRVANANGISLAAITGTGARGRIVKADLGLPPRTDSLTSVAVATPRSDISVYPPPAGVPLETLKLSSMRKTIARRLTEAKQTVPQFYLTVKCKLDPLLTLRGELNASLASRGVKLSVNDMLIKALALALVDVPHANVQFGGDVLHRFSRVDIAMAVAIDGGLMTPVIKDVASLSLSAIAGQSQTLAARARAGKLMPEAYQGGTASISNLGMFGIDEMFPVINVPQALILGIGAGVEQPWKVDGQIALATIMAATASFDHRVIDGAIAAQFMAAFRERVELPLLLCG